MGKNPAFPFYPGDWLKDPELRSCSIAAQGAWLNILFIMFECKPTGILGTDGVPWDEERLANAIRRGDTNVTDAISELKRNGVLKKNKDGFFYSKRLIEIGEERKKWVKRQKKCRNKKKTSHASVTPKSRSSSSSSSSSSSKESIVLPKGNTQGVIDEVVGFLNLKCGTKFNPKSKPTVRHISARIHEGYTRENLLSVVEFKVSEWLNTDLQKFLRPETLFGNKFEGYLQQADLPPPRSPTSKSGSDEWLEEKLKEEKK